VRAKKVGCRFCGTFCALVDAMLPWWACEACSTREKCKHVHDEPYSQSEVEIEHCGSAGSRDQKRSAGPWTRLYRFISLAGHTDYEAGGYCLITCSLFRLMQASRLDPTYGTSPKIDGTPRRGYSAFFFFQFFFPRLFHQWRVRSRAPRRFDSSGDHSRVKQPVTRTIAVLLPV